VRLIPQSTVQLRSREQDPDTRRAVLLTTAPDLVNQNFKVDAPNRLWAADLTMFRTGEGILWPASVHDAFSNRVVGWQTSPRAVWP
jgi:putative transposase